MTWWSRHIMPAKHLLADTLTKPLQGELFRSLTGRILGSKDIPSLGCVGVINPGGASADRVGALEGPDPRRLWSH